MSCTVKWLFSSFSVQEICLIISYLHNTEALSTVSEFHRYKFPPNYAKQLETSLDKLVPTLLYLECMRSQNIDLYPRPKSRHPLVLCVQTEWQVTLSGCAIAYRVNGEMRLNTKTYLQELKTQLPKKLSESSGFVN